MLSDLPSHLWTGVAGHLTLRACCDLTRRHPPLQWALLPRMTEMAQGQTLQQAVAGGHLSVCQWLTQHFGLTAADAPGATLLQIAVLNGHVAICQWLTEHFALAAHADVMAILDCALDNHVMTQWVAERFGLSESDVMHAHKASQQRAEDTLKAIAENWHNSRHIRRLLRVPAYADFKFMV
jgi:hypothetical protein